MAKMLHCEFHPSVCLSRFLLQKKVDKEVARTEKFNGMFPKTKIVEISSHFYSLDIIDVDKKIFR